MCDLVGRAFVDEEARFAVVDDAWDAAVSRADDGDEAGAGFFCDEDAAFAVAVSCDDGQRRMSLCVMRSKRASCGMAPRNETLLERSLRST